MTSTELSADEIRLDRYVRAVWRARWWIILLALAATGVAAFLANRQPAVYEATALVEVGRVWNQPLKDLFVTAETANSPGFVHELAGKINVPPKQLSRALQVEALVSGVPHARYAILIQITAKTDSPDQSVRFAQAMADEIVAWHEQIYEEAMRPHRERQQQLEDEVKQAQSSAATRDAAIKLESELVEVKGNNTSPIATAKTHLVGKIVAGGGTKPPIWRSAASWGLAAALAGLIVAVMIGHARDRKP
jgi:Chain length determinant protein